MSYPGESVSHDMNAFRDILKRSSNIVVLSGAGISAESGVPTFRGAGGLWRRWQAQELATPESFSKNPSLVWEFYNYRRDVMRTKHPNKAHEAISQLERDFEKEGKGRKVTIITQNIDRLHHRANSKCVLELHVCPFIYLFFEW
ncbi:NAD-dependent protein deacylase sirtuin-5, mitochondrial-like isoform X2 [Corticium candelabrum]|uniref:NAD-dependent protein deacylase sirtuin-5, mitochondrial-like isoform X2 n=1 Tax=Corticium candelabrum TaxID=121492 RepID=UPI002E2765BB|nr:NAD-dependent protein deacylase sirtuin-5, mitochondrial-like isoform X2 [Corticium candelabrum]